MTSKTGVFVINLKHRADRRVAMKRQLSKIGWGAEFFNAIRPREPAGFPSTGARGCFLSHLSILRNAHLRQMPRVVILEDDLNFNPGFPEKWKSAMSALSTREWSIFYAGHALDHLPFGLSRIEAARGVECTHFMAINGPALSTLIAGLETILSRPSGHRLGGPMHLDGAYSTLRAQNPALVTYANFPPLGYQRSSRSDVGNPKWFDRVRILSPIVAIARTIKAKS